MKRWKFSLPKFKLLPPEEQIEWVERKTRYVLKRLPTLKSKLSLYDDRTSEMYNLKPEEIRLMSKLHIQDIKSGVYTDSLSSYVKSLAKYSSKNINELALNTANERMQSWIENALENATGDEEREYIMKLVNEMSDNDIIGFTRSKFFLDTDFRGCTANTEFKNEFNIGIMTARLETYLDSRKNKTFDANENRYELAKLDKITR